MADIYRICAACSQNTPIEAQFCPHCGHDTHAGLPTKPSSTLPMVVGKAAVPMLVTAGTLAARLVWKLLRERALPAATTALKAERPQPLAPQAPQPPGTVPRPKRTIRIRSTWAVGDAGGNWRQGYTDHQIEFDD